LPHEKHTGLKQTLLNFRPGPKSYEIQHVLKGISFEIKRGEFFGIVGRNGSGKSTLLKILAGIYQPTSGQVTVHGKLVPFIELGVGFNPELTGRENVYLNGALLGFSRKETDVMYDGIVEFAELGDFMDQKLKNYSSGMQVRLAFSIAIRAKSDILLIDEVLAVGDEAFQRKCLDVFERYKAEKQTVVLVTHDMEMVRKFCNRAMLISDGEIIKIGNPRSVADKYSELNQKSIDSEIVKENDKHAVSHYLKADVRSEDMTAKTGFKFGDNMVVDIKWKELPIERLESIGVNIFKLSGEHLTGINTRHENLPASWKSSGRIGLQFNLDIMPGKYYVLVEAFEKEGQVLDSLDEGLQFTVAKTAMQWSGLVELSHKWRVGEAE
jgi:ABC-type polysaccharide/polyol phosphate transport system ATPase subunit